MRLGFTGTRSGMTEAQKATFRRLVREIRPTEFHHGDAEEGADGQAARIVYEEFPGCDICRHPGKDRIAGGPPNSPLGRDLAGPKGHFARNRDVVVASQVMLGTPRHEVQPPPKTGGGTWMTVDYSRGMAVPVGVIWPDGSDEWAPIPKPDFDVLRAAAR